MDAIHSDDGSSDEEFENNSFSNEIRSNGLAYPTYDSSTSSSEEEDSYYSSKPLNPEEIKNHLKGNLSFGLPSKYKADAVSIDNEKSSPVGGILLRHLTQPKVDYIAKEIESSSALQAQNDDIRMGYRLVRELMSPSLHNINSPFAAEIINNSKCNAEMLEVTKTPMWLLKIKENIINGVYNAIDGIVKDVRIMLQNAYTFYGPMHSTSKKGLHLEYQMEKRLAALPEDMKEICSLEKTHGLKMNEEQIVQTKSSRICVKGEFYFSQLLYEVKGCKLAREKEVKLKRMDALKKAKREKELEFVRWEELTFEDNFGTKIRAMWELPQIGQFLTICLFGLKIYAVSQYEIERMLLAPEHSVALRMIMTSLVSSPIQRQKIDAKPYMPYRVWANKLACRVQLWYKAYRKEKSNATKICEQLGIDPQFWEVCGQESPFQHSLFHELEFYKRVWLLKALCDFVAHNHRSIQEAIMEQPEENLREIVLGTDRDEYEYIYFPYFINHNVRIYRRIRVHYQEDAEANSEKDWVQDKVTDEMLDQKVFSKEQIQYYKAVLKQSKRKLQNEDDWESKAFKKRKRSKSARPKTPAPATPLSPRTRPRNLRQRPTPRLLNVQPKSSDDDSDSSEEVIKSWSRRSVSQSVNGCENTPLSQTRTRRKITRKMHTCTECEKQFTLLSRLNGHMATHSRKRKCTGRRSARQSPVNDDSSNLLVDQASNQEIPVDQASNQEIPVEQQEKTDSVLDAPETESAEITPSVIEDDSIHKVEVKSETDSTTGSIDSKVAVNCVTDLKQEITDDVPMDATCPKQELKTSESIKEELKAETFLKQESKMEATTDVKSAVESATVNENGTNDPIVANDDETTPKPVANQIEEMVWKFCDAKEFELVATSVEDLRLLVKRFGPVPSKLHKESKEDKNQEGSNELEQNDDHDLVEDEDSTELKKDLPACEKLLYDQLCSLLDEFSPYESKLKMLQKQIVRKMYKEEIEWKTKTLIYGDPDEEAWKSDPEPEPEPAPETPKVSSSSSSSADEFYDDGARKRKLRKRKCRAAPSQSVSLSASREHTPVPSPMTEDDEKTTVSSRGRVRKLKKMVNYDKLDFEKLAEEASNEAGLEKEKKKKKRYTPEEEVQASNLFKIPATGVQRYILSKTGDVVGYIDTGGKIHYTNKSKEVPRVEPAAPSAPITSPTRPISAISIAVPIFAVAAKTKDGQAVMIKVTGEPALSFMAKIKKTPPSDQIITVSHANQKLSFPHNSKYYTRNIPGYPDCEIPATLPRQTPPDTGGSVTISKPICGNSTPRSSSVTGISNVSPIQQPCYSPYRHSLATTVARSTPGQNFSKRIMIKTPKGPVPVSVSTTLASLLEKRQEPKVTTVSVSNTDRLSAGPSGTGGNSQPATKVISPIKIYKAPISSSVLGSASSGSRYVIVNQSPRQNVSVQPQTTNNFIQINNSNPNQYIQIQQSPNLVHYSQPTSQSVVQVLPQVTAAGSQPTFLPVASAGLPASPTYIRAAPVYNQVIVQSPTSVQMTAQPILIPQTVQQLTTAPAIGAASAAVTQPVLLSSPAQVQATAQPVLVTQAVQQIATTPSVAPAESVTKGSSKIFFIQTNEGRKVCLQTAEGKLVVLSDEQIQVLNNSGTLRSNST